MTNPFDAETSEQKGHLIFTLKDSKNQTSIADLNHKLWKSLFIRDFDLKMINFCFIFVCFVEDFQLKKKFVEILKEFQKKLKTLKRKDEK